ncbi:hypothetical protein PgNI_10556, partial [Pyricularia grisea]|uniref:Uncharacterized protein n=1 Tax=Pyricularia grisea TaxID=148305 RepID=A0A6P8AZM5_PYRGI
MRAHNKNRDLSSEQPFPRFYSFIYSELTHDKKPRRHSGHDDNLLFSRFSIASLSQPISP